MKRIDHVDQMDPGLREAVEVAAEAIANHFDVDRRYCCQDLSLVGMELLKDAGYPVKAITVDDKIFQWGDAGHTWIRTPDGWNIDFATGQFGDELTTFYPFISYKDWPVARELYGPRSVKPVIGKSYRWDDLSGTGPGIWLLEKAASLEDLEDLNVVGKYYIDLPAYYKAAQDWRRLMHERGRLMDKPELPIEIPPRDTSDE